MQGYLNLTLRPLKLAFLVNPKSRQSIRTAIQINSSLWGGVYNPIIPVYKQKPKIWEKNDLFTPKSQEFVSGYIDAFDSDYLIQCTEDLPQYIKNLGLKVIKADEIWKYFKDDYFFSDLTPNYGVGIFELFDKIFDKHFKFVSKYPVKIIIPQKSKSDSLFWASVFGELPTGIDAHIKKLYGGALSIEYPRIEAKDLPKILKQRDLFTLLKITKFGLKEYGNSSVFTDAVIYYLDVSKSEDIIDFWNLRALGKKVIPLPIHLKDDEHIKNLAIDFLKAMRLPLRHNKSIYSNATFLCMASTPNLRQVVCTC